MHRVGIAWIMTRQKPKAFSTLVDHLTFDQPHRVWSVLVTVFGDLAQDPGQKISGRVLRRIASEIGIRPEATRVALHRLRKEGWITSTRRGRSSDYALTDRGRRESRAASPRIYGASGALGPVYLVITDPAATSDDPRGAHRIAPHIYLDTRATGEPTQLRVRLSEASVPGWIGDRVCQRETIETEQLLATRLAALQSGLLDFGALSPSQVAVLRVLIVHSWRRIVLRVPDLADFVFPKSWPGGDCRARVAVLLQALPRPGEDELESGG